MFVLVGLESFVCLEGEFFRIGKRSFIVFVDFTLLFF